MGLPHFFVVILHFCPPWKKSSIFIVSYEVINQSFVILTTQFFICLLTFCWFEFESVSAVFLSRKGRVLRIIFNAFKRRDFVRLKI